MNIKLTYTLWYTRQGLIALVLMVMILTSQNAHGQTRMGVSASLGAGLFIAQNEDAYLGIKTDLYPEAGLQVDVSLLRVGLKAGFIYRKVELFFSSGFEENFTIAFVPLQAEVLIAPLDLFDPTTLISPYFGIMGGAFIAVGDNEETVAALSPKVGAELKLANFIVLFGDVRYTYADFDADFDNHLGGFIAMGGMGLRLGK